MINYIETMEYAADLAKQAAENIIMPAFNNRDLPVEYKPEAGNSPVTEADRAADRFLQKGLLAKYPDFGWLSEEIEDNHERLSKEYVWIVDPIDGTRAFIENSPEFVVSIGLVERQGDGKYLPVVGVIYQPVTGRIITAVKGGGICVDGEQFMPKSASSAQISDQIALTSFTERRKGMLDQLQNKFVMHGNPSIALKLALVAIGEGDFMLTLRPKNEWDTAAGHCICIEAGFKLLCLDNSEITYNCADPKMGGFIAARESAIDDILAIVN